MRQTYNCEVLPSDYRFRKDPTGSLTIYKPVISVHRASQPAAQAVEGFLVRRCGSNEEILGTTSSGRGTKEAPQDGDDMVFALDMFGLVKHIARQLCMSLNHIYDTQAGRKTVQENGEY